MCQREWNRETSEHPKVAHKYKRDGGGHWCVQCQSENRPIKVIYRDDIRAGFLSAGINRCLHTFYTYIYAYTAIILALRIALREGGRARICERNKKQDETAVYTIGLKNIDTFTGLYISMAWKPLEAWSTRAYMDVFSQTNIDYGMNADGSPL